MLADEDMRLRAVEAEDLDALYRWENDTAAWTPGCNLAPYSRKQIWDYVNNYDADIYATRQLRLIADIGGNAVGMIDLSDFDPDNRRASVGIYIDPEHRGRGLAERAITLVAAYARRHLGMHQLHAVVAVDNSQSLSAFRAAGFKPSGRLRSWLRRGESYADALVLQRLLTD